MIVLFLSFFLYRYIHIYISGGGGVFYQYFRLYFQEGWGMYSTSISDFIFRNGWGGGGGVHPCSVKLYFAFNIHLRTLYHAYVNGKPW